MEPKALQLLLKKHTYYIFAANNLPIHSSLGYIVNVMGPGKSYDPVCHIDLHTWYTSGGDAGFGWIILTQVFQVVISSILLSLGAEYTNSCLLVSHGERPGKNSLILSVLIKSDGVRRGKGRCSSSQNT